MCLYNTNACIFPTKHCCGTPGRLHIGMKPVWHEVLRRFTLTESPIGSSKLRLQKSHPQSHGRDVAHGGEKKALQQAIAVRDNQDQGCSPSAVWFLCVLRTQLSRSWDVWGEERRIKSSLLGLCDSTMPSVSACYPLTFMLQTTLFTLLLHQRVWGSFARDLFRHLSRVLCCKITSYLEMCMKKKGPGKKQHWKWSSSFTNVMFEREAVLTGANVPLSSKTKFFSFLYKYWNDLMKIYNTVP